MTKFDENIFWHMNNNYSDSKFRKKKVKYKLNIFKKLGINFNTFNTFLDLGCGNGELTRIIHKNNSKIIGLDHSTIAINTAIKIANEEKYFIDYHLDDISNSKKLKQIKNIDCCFAWCVLEHIDEFKINPIIHDIQDILSQKGKFLLVSSNVYSIFHLQKSLSEFFNTWKYGYEKNYSEKELRLILENNNFNVETSITFPCDGGRGLWSFFDKIIHFFNKNRGRYIFLIASK